METSEFTRVRDTKQLKVNIRVIAATNRDVQEDISHGKFREDLFYRLNLVTINSPPLRDRQEDIPLLAEYFGKKIARGANQPVKDMTEAFVERLQKKDWRGNIRELRNVIARSLIVCQGKELTTDNLPAELQYITLKSGILSAFDLSTVERLHIQRVLQIYKRQQNAHRQTIEHQPCHVVP